MPRGGARSRGGWSGPARTDSPARTDRLGPATRRPTPRYEAKGSIPQTDGSPSVPAVCPAPMSWARRFRPCPRSRRRPRHTGGLRPGPGWREACREVVEGHAQALRREPDGEAALDEAPLTRGARGRDHEADRDQQRSEEQSLGGGGPCRARGSFLDRDGLERGPPEGGRARRGTADPAVPRDGDDAQGHPAPCDGSRARATARLGFAGPMAPATARSRTYAHRADTVGSRPRCCCSRRRSPSS